jgi:HemY protein
VKTIFWLLLLFSLAVLLAVAARYNEGYAVLVVPPYRAAISLNLLVILVLAGFAALYLVLRVIARTVRMPRSVREFRQRKQREKAATALREAVRLLFEGRYGQALKQAEKAFAEGEAPGLSALLAARACRGMGDDKREGEWLGKLLPFEDRLHNARLMTEAELSLDARRFADALEKLDELEQRGQRHIAAVRLKLRAQQALGRWQDVLHSVRMLEKHHALSAEHASSLKQRAHLENLHSRGGDAVQLSNYWSSLPREDKREPRIAMAAARALAAAGAGKAACEIIETQLIVHWDPLMVVLYADCTDEDVVARIARAEEWLKSRPRDADLLLALGCLCRKQELWGKAQSYFEASLAIEPSRRAHVELASLFDHLQRAEDANRHYRAAAAIV